MVKSKKKIKVRYFLRQANFMVDNLRKQKTDWQNPIKKYQSLMLITIFPFLCLTVTDRGRSDVSGPIQSIKMYSYARCTMQERSVCCRDVPCLAHMELGSGPLHPEHLPPSLSAWGNVDSVYWQPSRRMDLDSGVEIRSQPNTDPVILDNVCDIGVSIKWLSA
jgi:hypothetical protein